MTAAAVIDRGSASQCDHGTERVELRVRSARRSAAGPVRGRAPQVAAGSEPPGRRGAGGVGPWPPLWSPSVAARLPPLRQAPTPQGFARIGGEG